MAEPYSIDDYREHGYAVASSVFGTAEIAEIAAEFDRFEAEGLKHPRTFRHQNMLYLIRDDPRAGRWLHFMQWPAYVSDVLQDYRVHVRLLEIVEPLIGNNLKQIINQLSWKPPGSGQAVFAYHQDCRFRRPSSAYRSLASSYVQTGIAIDPHRPENGCMKVYPGSHRLGDLKLNVERGVSEAQYDEECLRKHDLNPERLVDLILEPGDVALWGPYTIHGSGLNRSAMNRRFYLNGYVIAQNCDRGEWAFRDGRPCRLEEPVLVQYDDLMTRPEPHYVSGAPHPYTE